MAHAGLARAAAAALALLVLVAALPAGAASPSGLLGAQPVQPDGVLLAVALEADGDAAWRIEYRVELADGNDTAAFESLAADVRANRSRFVARFEERLRPTVAAAGNATGRGMTMRNVSVRTTRQELGASYGVLVYTFEWTNFAAANDTHLRAGGALAGLFLDGRTSLRLSWPAGYRPAAVDPGLDENDGREDRAVIWRGPEDFGRNQPRLVVTSSPADTATGGAPPGEGGDGAGGEPDDDLPILPIAAGVVLLALLGAAGWLYARRGDGVASVADDADDGGTDEAPPEELLSNEERVLRLLEENGGRMKQQAVVEELGWTDAKTSQVVGDLREAEAVESFRLGRENVLTLPGHDLAGDEGDT